MTPESHSRRTIWRSLGARGLQLAARAATEAERRRACVADRCTGRGARVAGGSERAPACAPPGVALPQPAIARQANTAAAHVRLLPAESISASPITRFAILPCTRRVTRFAPTTGGPGRGWGRRRLDARARVRLG